MRSPTPAALSITPRDRRFGRGADQRRHWLGGDPYQTAIYNALSVTFPKGEAFFVESVRAFREGTPPRLAGEIAAFVKQEVVHSREHVAFNRRVTDTGYDVSRLDRAVDERLALIRSRPPIVALAATIALEHYTAVLAHALLADSRHLDAADAESAALWRWHAIEEIEHKGVAYDCWLHATRNWSRWRRWSVKARVMLLVTHHFLVDRTYGALDLLAQDGIAGRRAGWGLARAAFVSPGLLRRIIRPWIAYFLPGFHPWNEDDRGLIVQTEHLLSTT